MGEGLRHVGVQFLLPLPARVRGHRSRQRAKSDGSRAGAFKVDFPRRGFESIVAISALAISCGCATAPSSPARDQPIGRHVIAVIPAGQVPGPTIGPGPPRRPATSEELALGAAAGAGAVALGAAAVAMPYAAPLSGALLVLQGLAVLGGVAAEAAGDGSKLPAESPQVTIERALSSALVDLPLLDLSAEAAVDAIRAFTPHRAETVEDPGPLTANSVVGYAILRQRGFTHVLEIRVTKVGIDLWSEIHSLGVIGVARLIDTSSGNTVWTKGLFYSAPGRSADYVLRDRAAPARTEYQRAARVLGERAVESLLLGAETTAPWSSSTTCGLAVIEPAPTWSGFPGARPAPGERAAMELIGPSPVRSLTPALAWEPAPRVLPGGANAWASDADIRYDLRIWSSDGDVPRDLVYERIGLAEARHKVETPLAPGSVYCWSVRMRAIAEGKLWSTPWSMAKYPEFARAIKVPSGRAEGDTPQPTCASYTCGCLDFIPPPNFYRFRTP